MHPHLLLFIHLFIYLFIFLCLAVAYTRGYDDQPRGEDLQNRRRSQGILKVGSASPRGQGYYSQSSNARN